MRIIKLLLCAAMVFFLLAGCVPKGDGGMLGSGTVLDPYQVVTAEDLDSVRNDLTASYIQMADIDLSAWGEWDPIGNRHYPGYVNFPFTGKYNGNRHKISGLTITRLTWPLGAFCGLFGIIDGAALVKDVYLENGSVTGVEAVGILAGCLGYDTGGTIQGCYSTGQVNGASFTGGLVGEEDGGHILDCYSLASVNQGDIGGIGYTQDKAGGLIGIIAWGATVENSFSAGAVSGASTIGGLIGGIGGGGCTITRCYYDMETSGQSDTGRGAPKTTAEMKAQATFIDWDFAAPIWYIQEGVSYPSFMLVISSGIQCKATQLITSARTGKIIRPVRF